MKALKALGWKAEVVWECETGNLAKLVRKIRTFLGPAGNSRLEL
jgi:G:T-mismatch repair DNA endonuclease (very short patch repair protein)